MSDAHITVSSVAVGPAADRELLHNIAVWGKGRDYTVQNAKDLPEVFVKEAKNAATPSFDEKEITPVVKAPAFLGAVDAAHAPKLKGITATVLKDTALEVMSTDEGDPLLAFWPIGLGRTAVFASDVKDRWAANWVRWRGYGPFFAAVVHAVERQRPQLYDLQATAGPTEQGRREIHVSLEAREANGGYRDLARPAVTVTSDQSRAASVMLRQVAPGRLRGDGRGGCGASRHGDDNRSGRGDDLARRRRGSGGGVQVPRGRRNAVAIHRVGNRRDVEAGSVGAVGGADRQAQRTPAAVARAHDCGALFVVY